MYKHVRKYHGKYIRSFKTTPNAWALHPTDILSHFTTVTSESDDDSETEQSRPAKRHVQSTSTEEVIVEQEQVRCCKIQYVLHFIDKCWS